MLLDVILANECSSCKEIFFEASRRDNGIGTATVYRMVNLLEEIGAIDRKNMYKISYPNNCSLEEACIVELSDDSTCRLSAKGGTRCCTPDLRHVDICRDAKSQESFYILAAVSRRD